MEDEHQRVLAYYLQCIDSGRLREDLADGCKLRWFTGRTARNPEYINEFMRFHVSPQFTHADFTMSEEPFEPHHLVELIQRYNLFKCPNKKLLTNNANNVSPKQSLTNQTDSDIEDTSKTLPPAESRPIGAVEIDGTSLCEDELQQLERTPPPSTRKQASTPAAATQLVGNNAGEVTQCLLALGELRQIANATTTATTDETMMTDAVVKVRLVLFYRFRFAADDPEFVYILYERIGEDGRCPLPSARLNLFARLQSSICDDNDDVVDDDNNDETRDQISREHTPPPSATATPPWQITPSSVMVPTSSDSVSNTSTSRKRQHESDERKVTNKRKAMRRLRL